MGEKFGLWGEAVDRVAALGARTDAPPVVFRQWAAGAGFAGDRAARERALRLLADRTGAAPALAAAVAEITALNYVTDPTPHAAQLATLARRALAFEPSAVDGGFAAAFNNVTTALLEKSLGQPLTADVRAALVDGAAAARHFWLRAGSWMEDERSDYLCAKVALRTGDADAALASARRALALIEANGNDAVERAFILQPLAAALQRRGEAARASALRGEADALAAAFDASFRPYYDGDTRELFGDAAAGQGGMEEP
jgi:hypothetical protein